MKNDLESFCIGCAFHVRQGVMDEFFLAQNHVWRQSLAENHSVGATLHQHVEHVHYHFKQAIFGEKH